MFPNPDSAMPGNWRKSSHSGQDGSCVETASGEGLVLVRDTTQEGTGPVLAFPAASWVKFAGTLR